MKTLLAQCCFVLTLVLAQSHALYAEEQIHRKVTPLKVTQEIKAVYQINTNKLKRNVNRGIHYLTYLMDHYARLGIPDKNISLVGVFYGDAITSVLKNSHHKSRGGRTEVNPNIAAINALIKKGVKIEACSETMRLRGITHAELLPGVEMVEGSYVRIIDLQQQGYAYIKFL